MNYLTVSDTVENFVTNSFTWTHAVYSTFQNTHLAPQVYVLVDAHTITYLISPLIKYQNSSFDLKSALGQQNLWLYNILVKIA